MIDMPIPKDIMTKVVIERRATQMEEALARAKIKAKRRKKLENTGDQTVLEYKVKEAVKERLNAIGAYHFWPVQSGLGATTIDCLGCYNGRFFGIETKATGKVPSPRQEFVIAEIRAAGGEVLVIDSIEAAENLFIELADIEHVHTVGGED